MRRPATLSFFEPIVARTLSRCSPRRAGARRTRSVLPVQVCVRGIPVTPFAGAAAPLAAVAPVAPAVPVAPVAPVAAAGPVVGSKSIVVSPITSPSTAPCHALSRPFVICTVRIEAFGRAVCTCASVQYVSWLQPVATVVDLIAVGDLVSAGGDRQVEAADAERRGRGAAAKLSVGGTDHVAVDDAPVVVGRDNSSRSRCGADEKDGGRDGRGDDLLHELGSVSVGGQCIACIDESEKGHKSPFVA